MEWMTRREVSASALATLLGPEVNEDQVRNWRKGLARPPLHLLPRISEVLGMGGDRPGEHDPAYLLTRMGLLPMTSATDPISIAYRVQKLELRYREALERNAAAGREFGASSIARAVTRSGKWAVAVFPAIEGPPDCRMHVADRIDIIRTDGEPTNDEEVFADPLLHQSLRDAYAVRSTRFPRWISEDASVSRWSVAHVGAPMSPRRRTTHPGAVAALCYALTVESWVNDVASLLATAIGYGLSTTRDLAMEVTGVSAGSTSTAARNLAHSAFLRQPPKRRVWSHHAVPTEQVSDPFATRRDDVPIVWIREDDVLLEQFARRPGSEPIEFLKEGRDALDEQVRGRGADVLVIEAHGALDIAARWAQVLEHVRRSIEHFENRGLLDARTREEWPQISRSDPDVAAPFLGWLMKQPG